MRHTKFILCCALFTFICVFGSAAAFAEGGDAALLDREGRPLTAENFAYYDAALEAFADSLEAGNSVKISIDLELQENILRIMNEDPVMGSKNAMLSAVVLDIETGAPLALINRGACPLISLFAPRQLFLPCTALAALNYDIVRPDTLIPCEGVFDRYADAGIAPECWIWSAAPGQQLTHTEENVRTALRDSCQYFFYSLGSDLGIDALADYARSLGLGEDTGIELPASKGVLASREEKTGESWIIGDTLEAAVGRSVSEFTPLQYARYCAAIANGGKLYSASLVNEMLSGAGESLYSRQPELMSEAPEMAEENWEAVRQGLFTRLNDPIAPNAAASEIPLMAGTGSTYSDDGRREEIFMGYAPYDAPRYAIAVAASTIHGVTVSAHELAYKIMDVCME
ncbi:MAG: hypothetical protein IJY96_07245 [Oscillospiraceae bacterium]|nr:hypothetical protein [Oscillospiraceae bacterium]